MKTMLTLILLVTSLSAWSNSGRERWTKATLPQKAKLLEEYRVFYQQLTKTESKSYQSWKRKQTSLFNLLIDEAWATNMDCIYAGWPSKRVGQYCSSPARQNPDYNQGSCSANQMQCQPMLFGKGLCVPTSTREQRVMAFSNCNSKFRSSNRSSEDVVKEIQTDGKESELLELMDYADNICKSGKQAGTGMCRRLVQVLDDIKPHLAAKKDVSVEEHTTSDVVEAAKIANEGIEVVAQGGTVDQTEDCLPEEKKESTQKVQIETAEIVATVPEIKDVPARDKSIYTPQQALSDINNGELQFLGRDLFPGSDQNRTCVFKSKTAYVLYYNCMANKKEAPATDIEVISFDGGVVRYYVENYHDTGKISQMDRSQYDGSWNTSFTPSDAPGNLNVAQLKAYKEKLLIPKDGACWVGDTGGAKKADTKSNCYGNSKPLLEKWGPEAESFWKDPGAEWKTTHQKLRRLVETAF